MARRKKRPAPPVEEQPVEIDLNNLGDGVEIVTEETPIPPAVEHSDQDHPEELPFPEEHHDENPEEHHEEEHHEEEDNGIIRINTITPFYVAFNELRDGTLGTIYYLCKSDRDKLFILNRNITCKENEEEKLINLECLPFAALDSDHQSRMIAAKTLNKYLDSYMSDFKFRLSNNVSFNKIEDVHLSGTHLMNKNNVEFLLNPDRFACLNYIDDTCLGNSDSEHDLLLATVAGSKDCDSYPEFFMVDEVEVISMASAVTPEPEPTGFFEKLKAKFKHEEPVHTTNVGMVIRVSSHRNGYETAYILTPFDVGVEFDESKFKGKTIDQIENEFYGDHDQYVATLTTLNTKLDDIDKEFMIIRGKTKDKNIKIFLFDFGAREMLRNKINEF